MPLALDKAVETGRPLVCRHIRQFLSVATIVCFAFSGPSRAQESIIIGSGLPAIEVNEEAAYHGLSQTRIPTHRLPLFNPNEHILESRILNLPLPGSVNLRVMPDPEDPSTQKLVDKSPVIEESVREVHVRPDAQNQAAPTLEDPKPQSTPSQESSQQNQAEVNNPPAKSPKTELAAIPPTQQITSNAETPELTVGSIGDAWTIIFGEGEKDIPDGQQGKLTGLLNGLLRDENSRLQLKSYASDLNGSPSGARRLSLARALTVRSFLIEAGVNSTRIDIRALGAKNESGPADRVDLVVAN